MAAKMSRLTGSKEMDARFSRMMAERPQRVGTSIFRFGTRVMSDSQDNFVPVKYSILRASGRTQLPVVSGTRVSVDLTFGGAAQAYALAIHEHPSRHSPRSWKSAEAKGRPVKFRPSGRGPKYLERPLMRASGDFMRFIADDLRNG